MNKIKQELSLLGLPQLREEGAYVNPILNYIKDNLEYFRLYFMKNKIFNKSLRERNLNIIIDYYGFKSKIKETLLEQKSRRELSQEYKLSKKRIDYIIRNVWPIMKSYYNKI